MANSIEIFQNTLLKLIVRNGPNSDRLNVVLSLGELGYTTDTKRLYVGDGTTAGGRLVGNVFAGSATAITTLTPSSVGDLAYDTDNRNLYRLQNGDGSVLGDWEHIGGVYSAANDTITITSDNKISLGLLSAANFDPSIADNPIYIHPSTKKISLSADVIADSIRPRNTTAVTLFSSLSVGGVNYNWPATPPTAGQALFAINGNADLRWQNISLSAISSKTITVLPPLTATANGENCTGTAVNPLTADIRIGVSPSLSSVNLWARYSSTFNTIISNKGIPSVNRTGQGRYTFSFANDIGQSNPYASATIIGSAVKMYDARITSVNNLGCTVEVFEKGNVFLYQDADLAIKIEV